MATKMTNRARGELANAVRRRHGVVSEAVPGIGALTASALVVATVGDAKIFEMAGR